MPERGPEPRCGEGPARYGRRYRNNAITAAARGYDRERHLPRILDTTVEERADWTHRGRRHLIARLLRLARNSARAGAAGHWSYDPNRHFAILGALQAERAELTALMSGEPRQPDRLMPPRSRISRGSGL